MTRKSCKLLLVCVLVIALQSGYCLAANKVVVIPLSSGGGAAAGQSCPGGEFVYGFDVNGNILCSSSTKTVFVTSNYYNGDLGGVTGADDKCQAAANSAGLSGVYKAWISVATSSPSIAFTQSVVPYVTTRGDRIASNWTDLTDGTLINPILGDEYGTALVDADVWTNTKADGTISSLIDSCDNFTSSAGGVTNRARVGLASRISSAWTSGATFECVFGMMRLYCFQQ